MISDRLGARATRYLDASNPSGNFTGQGGSNIHCGMPANPMALASSVTGLGNISTGYLRVFPFNGTGTEGLPVPLNTINTTATNDIIVQAQQRDRGVEGIFDGQYPLRGVRYGVFHGP